MTPPGAAPPLLVVGHGTTHPAGVAGFVALLDRVREAAGAPVVAGGFLELSDPPLREVVADSVAAGYDEIAVVPLVLGAAGHAKGDLPGALARERVRHPGLVFRYGRPLGPHPRLLDLLDERLATVLAPMERTATTVVLVGRGSTDPDANAEHVKVARLFWEGRGLAAVEPAFVSLADPGVPAALERCRRLGAERIVVSPYLLFPGVLPDRVVEQTRTWARAHPDLDVRCAEVLGPGSSLAELVVDRYREALAGDLRMNCDTCLYRVALPGHAHRVGAPQRPHDHPHDPVSAHRVSR